MFNIHNDIPANEISLLTTIGDRLTPFNISVKHIYESELPSFFSKTPAPVTLKNLSEWNDIYQSKTAADDKFYVHDESYEDSSSDLYVEHRDDKRNNRKVIILLHISYKHHVVI